MSVVQADLIPDIIVAGLKDLGRGKIVDLTSDTQEHVAWNMMMRKDRVKPYTTGYGIQWTLMTDHNNSARAVGLYSTDNVNAPSVLTQATIPWRHVEASYCIDYHEIDMNQGASQIVDLLKTRRYGAMVSMAEFFEDRFWRLPAADDTRNIYGIPYWIVKNATEGFNGGAPSGYTTVAGLNPSTLTRWKNYTGQYADIDNTDLIPMWERACDKTLFKAPVNRGIGTFNTGDKFMFATNYTVYQGTKQLLRSQNDDLGMDLDPFDQSPVFRGVKVQWVPQLDADTTDPVYGINFGEFKAAILKPWWMKEAVIPRLPGQHNVTGVFIDSSVNPICFNRRRQFVLATGTTLPD